MGETPTLVLGYHCIQGQANAFGLREEAGIDLDRLDREWEIVRSIPMGRALLLRFLATMDDEQVPNFIANIADLRDAEYSYYVPILLQFTSPQETLAFAERAGETNPSAAVGAAGALALVPGRQQSAKQRCLELIEAHESPGVRLDCPVHYSYSAKPMTFGGSPQI